MWRNTCIWLHLNAVDNSGQRQWEQTNNNLPNVLRRE